MNTGVGEWENGRVGEWDLRVERENSLMLPNIVARLLAGLARLLLWPPTEIDN